MGGPLIFCNYHKNLKYDIRTALYQLFKLEIPDDKMVNDLVFIKYSSITSVDVERSFSIKKNLLLEGRFYSKILNNLR
ncbi:Uncharacterized protein FWK35_00039255 [Aphis craccivora]|uniref:Uncharacterized protein n=1 Tax=Aphis craccivora TaxID=307492 RepID=A0A6G0VI66_APHCR|nr:Uncharacterized protein FWK35_00039255 [Aphis craccivora]